MSEPFNPWAVPQPTHSSLIGVGLGIGDINSDAKGSGARYNAGKPDVSLLPLTVLADSLFMFPHGKLEPAIAIKRLGHFQATHDIMHLKEALVVLGPEGWVECARVFSYGAKKYTSWNWARGMPWSVPLGCAVRHLLGMWEGMELDDESNEPHRGHVFCNIAMLLTFSATYPEGNDLPSIGLTDRVVYPK